MAKITITDHNGIVKGQISTEGYNLDKSLARSALATEIMENVLTTWADEQGELADEIERCES